MKSKIRFLLLADNAIVDSNTGKMSAIGLFDKVEAGTPINFVVAGQLGAEGYESIEIGELEVKIIGPDKKAVDKRTVRGGFGDEGKIQFTCYFQGVKFETPGEYCIELLLNGDPPTKEDRLSFFQVVENG